MFFVTTLLFPHTTESRPLVLSTPLQTLTIPDRPPPASPRSRFLKKFRAGAASEGRLRRSITRQEKLRRSQEENDDEDPENDDDDDENAAYEPSSSWAEMAQVQDDLYQSEKQRQIDQAFDEGFQQEAAAQQQQQQLSSSSNVPFVKETNEYQFVGVVQGSSSRVKWYARKKKKSDPWSIRLVKVDRAAILRDQFVRRKIDIYGKYVNKGLLTTNEASTSSEQEEQQQEEENTYITRLPNIQPEYTIKERSWRTLWNFSPRAFFTDRSGMYWRQRRLPPGMYTDGDGVFQTTYHYGQGRNGMKRAPFNLEGYCKFNNISKETMEERLSQSPDLVLEY